MLAIAKIWGCNVGALKKFSIDIFLNVRIVWGLVQGMGTIPHTGPNGSGEWGRLRHVPRGQCTVSALVIHSLKPAMIKASYD